MIRRDLFDELNTHVQNKVYNKMKKVLKINLYFGINETIWFAIRNSIEIKLYKGYHK